MAETEVRYNDGADVGDVLVSSWGYDQTNVDYYKVTRRTEASVWLVKIGQKHVPGSEGFMSEQVVPDPENVLPWRGYEGGFKNAPEGETTPQRKKVKPGYNGRAYVRLTSYSGATPVQVDSTGEFGSSYQSWYA
jgi:hypothetical protein